MCAHELHVCMYSVELYILFHFESRAMGKSWPIEGDIYASIQLLSISSRICPSRLEYVFGQYCFTYACHVHYPKLYNMAHLLALYFFTASKGSNNYFYSQCLIKQYKYHMY